ncbi:GxxExxY protein [bacterium]|nr:GxxExxY protein [bacterium]
MRSVALLNAVEGKVIIEQNAVSEITGIHEAQSLTYMKLPGITTGLLINVNQKLLKDGIKRFRFSLFMKILCALYELCGIIISNSIRKETMNHRTIR